MKRLISQLLILSMLSACSTAGGFYKKDDATHGEFSPIKTIGAVIGVAAVVAAAAGGGGSSYADSGYAWDYQPGNGQWVCRDKANGQYAYKEKCKDTPYVDNWP